MYKLGIIGFGSIASGYHLTNSRREDVPVTVTAVFDVREERRTAAQSQGICAFDNLGDFLAAGRNEQLFDIVLVATPNNNHCYMTCAALESGFHVICEKPAAMNSSELAVMIQTANEHNRQFTIHQNRRWDRDFLIIKSALDDGLVGKPYTIESRIHPEPRTGGGEAGWRGFADHGGGMLLDWGVHMLDQILYMISEPIVSVSANIVNHRGNEVDDYSKTIITFESGLVAQVEVATFTPVRLPRWFILGEEGGLTMETISSGTAKVNRLTGFGTGSNEAYAYTKDGWSMREQSYLIKDGWQEFEYPPAEKMPAQDWASFYKNYIAALDGTAELIVKPDEVMRCFKVIEAAFLSSDEQRTVLFR